MIKGEELALLDVYLTWEQTVDPAGCNTNETVYETVSRDPVRTPFPWDATTSAGFSTSATTWLPVSPDYQTVNVKVQREAAFSHLKIFKQLSQIRKTKTFQEGDLTSAAVGTDVLVYRRALTGYDTYIVMLNFGTVTETLNLVTTFPTLSGHRLEVITSSLQSNYLAG